MNLGYAQIRVIRYANRGSTNRTRNFYYVGFHSQELGNIFHGRILYGFGIDDGFFPGYIFLNDRPFGGNHNRFALNCRRLHADIDLGCEIGTDNQPIMEAIRR